MSFVIMYLPTAEIVPFTKRYKHKASAKRFIQNHTFRYFNKEKQNVYVSSFHSFIFSENPDIVPKHLLEVIEVDYV